MRDGPSRMSWSWVSDLLQRRLSRAVVLVPLLAILVSCKDPNVSLGEGAREYTPMDYPQVLKRWTRSESLISLSELDDLLTVTATYESWDFRWAYVIRYAEDYRLTVDQRRGLLSRTLNETQDGHRFYIALYGTTRRGVDLGRPTSGWIVRLIDDEGGETAPTAIEAIAKPGAIERTYFPYTTPFRNVFRIKFPLNGTDGRPTVSPHAKWFGLRFAGAEGNEELHWEISTSTEKRTAFGPQDLDAPQLR
jgi:hypothetical protein